MLKTFEQITVFGTGDAQDLAEGISIALVTTEIGLVSAFFGAIALIVGHVFTFGKVEDNEEIKESEKSYAACVVLNLFLGAFGAHHFYAGKIGMGVFYLLTLGGFIIGQYIDFINLAWGKFCDSEGGRIRYKKGANQASVATA